MFARVLCMASMIVAFLCPQTMQTIHNRCSQINYKSHSKTHKCSAISFCNKDFNISYIQMVPYAPSKGLQEFLKLCCRNCTRFNVLNTFMNISEVNPESIHSSNFVYPFLGSVTDKMVNGYYFIPVLHVPKAYYMTPKTEVSLFLSLFQLLPLVLICLLMAAIAGFICWLAETRSNTDQFPTSFMSGKWFLSQLPTTSFHFYENLCTLI